METHFQHQFYVNIWCCIIGNLWIGQFVIANCMALAYYLNSFRAHSLKVKYVIST
jgi:hypothetical protein